MSRLRSRVFVAALVFVAGLVLASALLTVLLYTMLAAGALVCGVGCAGCAETDREACAVYAARVLAAAGVLVALAAAVRWGVVRRRR